MIPAGAVVAAARGWIGVPYLHQGRSRSGIDCIGLVLQVAREAGIGPADLDFRRYGRMPQREMIEAELPRWCAPGEAQAGACRKGRSGPRGVGRRSHGAMAPSWSPAT